tara:strand:- start:203 stop:826 length:624 start_codon:yes stop_codon:yes gene_type:complete
MNFKALIAQYGWQSIPRAGKKILRYLGVNLESFYLLEYKIDKLEVEAKMKKYDYSDVQKFFYIDIKDSNLFDKNKKQLFKQRFESKDYSCFGIKSENEICYFTWISWKFMNYPSIFNIQETLQENEALLEDSFCDSKYRGRGYHSKMNLFRLNVILGKDIKTAIVLILKENTPALKVQVKSGFKIKEVIKYYNILNKSRIKRIKYNA